MREEQPAPAVPSSKKGDAAAAPEGSGPTLVREPGVHVTSLSLHVLAVIAVILVLKYAQRVLIPVVLGVLISYALAPLVGALHRLRIARAIGAAVAIALLLASLGVGSTH